MIKILLDTNMFIYLEDNNVTDSKILELTKRIYDSNEYKIVIHPKTKEEINGIKNKEQKEIFKSKIAVYREIKSPPTPNDDFHNLVGCNNKNDEIDNHLLFAIKRNCASYLVTNDKKIKHKSHLIGIADRVLTINEALDKFKILNEDNQIIPPFIEEKFLYQLEIKDKFFDSLKDDYHNFEEWFIKKQKDEAKAFVTSNNNRITSFLMLKVEDEKEKYEIFEKPFSPARRLKISTFKVSETGKRIGETFIKIIMENALKENVDEIYVTIFDKQEFLIDMLGQYGFHFYCKKRTPRVNGNIEKENVYVKFMKHNKESYPFFEITNKKVFIVPIKEKFHNILFQSSEKVVQLSLDDITGTNTASNSLKKAYICDSNTKKITPGSILLFYSSGRKKAITSLGIADVTFNNFTSFSEMYNLVKRRTAYSENELKKVYKANKLVILFKHYYSFDEYIPFKYLLEKKIVKWNIQGITEIKIDSLHKIFKYCKFDTKKHLI